MAEPILRVVLARPLSRSFDYLPPAGVDPGRLRPGIRVRVPFGRGHAVGVLLELAEHSELAPDRLKRAGALLDEQPLLPPDLVQFARRASDYYHHPLGEVMMITLPPALRAGETVIPDTQTRWFARPGELGGRAPVQARLLAAIRASGEQGSDADALAQLATHWRAPLQGLVDKGLVERREIRVDRSIRGAASDPEPALNPEQARAVNRVARQSGFRCFLLQGVTGSGKTEVYLRLIQGQLAQGRQSLLLVPEIGLTPQLVDRFRRRLDTRLVVFHSGLSDTERARAWRLAAEGRARVLLGTRSAVFTPLAEPGLILIDEEHDPSFKQQEGFRYHARDLAVLRASQLDLPIVLGSATPSLESLRNARDGVYELLALERRAGGARPPRLALMDVRGRRLHGALPDTLVEPIRRHLAGGSQVLVFLNRRGFAPVLICHDCGWTADCRRCDAHMTLHQGSGRLRCHHCGAERPPDPACGGCGAAPLIAVGKGTERIEQDLQGLFPDTPVLRIDRDTTRRKGALQSLLDSVHGGQPAILVGTQMIGKGHHFPDVTLVVALDADRGLYGTDFRATEQMAQTLIQVAGRAGRAERPGEVIITTHAPQHPALVELVGHGYEAFATALLAERREAGFPPYARIALVRAESHHKGLARDFLFELRADLQGWDIDGLVALGPAAAPRERVAGRYRSQLLLQSDRRAPLHRALHRLRRHLEDSTAARKLRWSLDVDPVDMS